MLMKNEEYLGCFTAFIFRQIKFNDSFCFYFRCKLGSEIKAENLVCATLLYEVSQLY